MNPSTTAPSKPTFDTYQIFIIAILAILQFTVILDFMVLSPLGAQLMPVLNITPSQFGLVVSVYALSAGASGLLAAGFADKFDRKKLLLFFYTGFIFGTFLCGIAPNYPFLLMARIVTGIFGGVLGSVGFAIITDLFKMEVRGRVMGFVQMAFAGSQVLGLPIGLVLANHFGWHAPFLMIVGFSILVFIAIFIYMKPVDAHLKIASDRSPLVHLLKTLTNRSYIRGFMATILLATGGFMLMPFGSAFGINNLGLTMASLPILYGVTGVFSMITGPLSGKLSDKMGKFNLFCIGTAISILMVLIYTNLGITPLWAVIALNVVLFAGIMARMIPASALLTALPSPQDRGAFMGINSSLQQIAGGLSAAVAGLIVVQTPNGALEHYNTLGLVVIGCMLVATYLMYLLNKHIQEKMAAVPAAPVAAAESEVVLVEV